MKEPCKHCPFRFDVKPFLRPKRGEELAMHAYNRYNSFPCHKTTEYDESSDNGNMVRTAKSLECAGFLTLQINLGARCPDGFIPSELVYNDADEMMAAYEEQED
jgi:hypothetical protein